MMDAEVLWPLATFFMGAGVIALIFLVLPPRRARLSFKEFREIREGGYEYALEQGARMIEECALDPDEKPHAARNARLLRRLLDASHPLPKDHSRLRCRTEGCFESVEYEPKPVNGLSAPKEAPPSGRRQIHLTCALGHTHCYAVWVMDCPE